MSRKKIENSYTMKDLPVSERPREKLKEYGVSRLSNSELISIIIRTGYRDYTALDLANKILTIDETGIKYLSEVSLEELQTVKGIGECKAAQLLASVELGKRISTFRESPKLRINSPKVVVDMFMEEMKYFKKEHFRSLNLDTKNQIISIEEISVGNLNTSIVHPREVFNKAIKRSANSVILLHNHPSGDATPSQQDINVTLRLIEVGMIVGIEVLDHIILGNNTYTSMKQENII